MKFKILTMIARIFHFLFCLCECRCITYYWLLTTVTVVSNAPTTYSCSSFAVGGWDDYTYIQNDRISKNEKVCISAEQFSKLMNNAIKASEYEVWFWLWLYTSSTNSYIDRTVIHYFRQGFHSLPLRGRLVTYIESLIFSSGQVFHHFLGGRPLIIYYLFIIYF